MSDPTKRFSNRVEDYIKHRPGYPVEILDLLKKDYGLTSSSVIADVGSGTGISTELFLKNGNPVIGVEPNKEMREAAERLLKEYPKFRSISATAEATTLDSNSIDFIISGQAFHWFKRDPARKEFIRILKPQGWVVLIWNDRKTDTTPFLKGYEDLLRKYSTDYANVDHKHINEQVINSFFGPGKVFQHAFPNSQTFNFEGLKGRLESSSYTPVAGHPNYEPIMAGLRSIFDLHQQNNQVTFDYDTVVFCGRFS